MELGDGEIGCMDTFRKQLDGIMAEIRGANRRGVFMKVPIEQGAVLPLAAAHGFKYHHAEGTSAMLLNWLPENEPSPVPDFATHVIGLGGLVLNDKHEVLCVKEKNAPAATSQGSWKVRHFRACALHFAVLSRFSCLDDAFRADSDVPL